MVSGTAALPASAEAAASDSQGTDSQGSNGQDTMRRVALRRYQQDYIGSVLRLPEATWRAMARASSPSKRAEILVEQLYAWGLRLPTESTLATMTAVISLFQEEYLSDFELHSNLTVLRKVWKKTAKRHGTIQAPEDWIATWPEDLASLPESVRQSLGENPPPISLPVSSEQISNLASRVPLRETHSSVVEVKQEQKLLAASMHLRNKGGCTLEDVGGLKNLMIFPREERKGRPSALRRALTDEALESAADRPSGPAALPEPARVEPGLVSAPATLPQKEAKEAKNCCQVCLCEVEEGLQPDGTCVCFKCLSVAKGEPEEEAPKASALELAAEALMVKREEDKAKKRPAAAKAKTKPAKQSATDTTGPVGGTGVGGASASASTAGKAKAVERQPKAKEASATKDSAGPKSKAKGRQPPAAGEGASKRRKNSSEEEKSEEIFNNFMFQSAKHGKCKVEFYTEKSYVRKWCEEQQKWEMLIGSTDKQWHKHLCKRLVSDVTRGLDRAALKAARDGYSRQMGNA